MEAFRFAALVTPENGHSVKKAVDPHNFVLPPKKMEQPVEIPVESPEEIRKKKLVEARLNVRRLRLAAGK